MAAATLPVATTTMAASTSLTNRQFVASKPADLFEPSFLDLPPEIRNYVYRIWFPDEPTQLAEHEDGHLGLMRRPAADHMAGTESLQDLSNENTNGIPLAAPRWIEHGALNFLRVSRQMHHEASSMLYAGDVFVHAPLRNRHDATGQYIDSAPVSWLRQIASYSSFVRKIVIDLAAIGPSNCVCHQRDRRDTFRRLDRYLHIGRIIDLIWTSHTELNISFANTGQIPISCCTGGVQVVMSTSSACDPKQLTYAVRQLGQDVLGMKKFRRATADIGIKQDGTKGVFVFRTTDSDIHLRYQKNQAYFASRNPVFDHASYFETDDGGVFRIANQESAKKAGLIDLPRKVLEKIINHVSDSGTVHEIDLDSDKKLYDLYGKFVIHRLLGEKSFFDFVHTLSFNISMSTQQIGGEFATSKLAHLLATRFTRVEYGSRQTVDFRRDLH